MRTADTFSYNSSISACSVAWTQSLQCFGDMAGVMTRDLVAYNAASHALGSSGFWMQSLRFLSGMSEIGSLAIRWHTVLV